MYKRKIGRSKISFFIHLSFGILYFEDIMSH